MSNIEGFRFENNSRREDEVRLALYNALSAYKGEDKQRIFDNYFYDVKYFDVTLDEACSRINKLTQYYENK